MNDFDRKKYNMLVDVVEEIVKRVTELEMANKMYHSEIELPEWGSMAYKKAKKKGIMVSNEKDEFIVSEETLKTLVQLDKLKLLD